MLAYILTLASDPRIIVSIRRIPAAGRSCLPRPARSTLCFNCSSSPAFRTSSEARCSASTRTAKIARGADNRSVRNHSITIKNDFAFLLSFFSHSRECLYIYIYARLHTFTHRHARLSSHLNTRARTRMLSLIPSQFLYISHMKVMEELLGLRARLVDCLICRFQVSG